MTYEHCVRDIQTLPEHFFFDFIYVLNVYICFERCLRKAYNNRTKLFLSREYGRERHSNGWKVTWMGTPDTHSGW